MKLANTYRFSKTGFFSDYTLEADFENPVIEPNGAGVKIDGWTHYSPSTTLSVEPHNGSDWLKVVSTVGSHGAHQGFSVEPGETYTFEIDLYRPTGMNKEINIVIWKNTGPSGALSIHVLNTDGFNTFNYTATSSNIYIQIRQAGTYYLDNIRMYRTYEDTIFVSGYEVDMAYRYGYQGSEKTDELKGSGNHYTTFFRQLDPRLGRWLTIDPKANPWESPYASMANSPILANDPQGDFIPIIIAGIVYFTAAETAVIVTAGTIATVMLSSEIQKSMTENYPQPHYWDRPEWNIKPYHPSGGITPFSPGGGKGPKLAKWIVGTGMAAVVLDRVFSIYGEEAPKAKYDSDGSLVEPVATFINPEDSKMSISINVTDIKEVSEKKAEVTVRADVIYKIQKGDNLTKIAEVNNVSIDQLIEWNNISDPNSINAGENLKVNEAQVTKEVKVE